MMPSEPSDSRPSDFRHVKPEQSPAPEFTLAENVFDLAMLPTDTVRGNGVGLSDNMPSYSRWTRG